MAIEFGSRKENFDNFKVYETTLAGRPFKVEMGKMCGLSNASALIRYGETCVMCNVVMSPKPREGVDFFPLNVEYEEKLYAAGRIPGSFMRREGRPGERAILTSRVVDRPMRPLFPKEMRNDVCITMTVMSLDPDCSPEIAGMIGASLVTAVSEIPWNGPIGGVQVGLVDGEIVLNPTQEQRKKSDLALTVAATMDKIVMIEAGANEVDEDTMLNAIKAAHVEIKKIITFINGIVAERGKPKIDFQVVGLDMDVFHAIKEKYLDDFKAAMDTDDKNVRDAAPACPSWTRSPTEYPDPDRGRPRPRPATRCRSTSSAAGCWTRASAWMAAASTRSARWPQKSASCPVCMVPVCSPAARLRCSPPAPSAAPRTTSSWMT